MAARLEDLGEGKAIKSGCVAFQSVVPVEIRAQHGPPHRADSHGSRVTVPPPSSSHSNGTPTLSSCPAIHGHLALSTVHASTLRQRVPSRSSWSTAPLRSIVHPRTRHGSIQMQRIFTIVLIAISYRRWILCLDEGPRETVHQKSVRKYPIQTSEARTTLTLFKKRFGRRGVYCYRRRRMEQWSCKVECDYFRMADSIGQACTDKHTWITMIR